MQFSGQFGAEPISIAVTQEFKHYLRSLAAVMRIAFISAMASYPWGGSEVLWSSTAKKLVESGHQVFASVNAWPEAPPALEVLESCGVCVQRRKWQKPTMFQRLSARLGFDSADASGWKTSWRQIVEFKPDIVCISNGMVACGREWMVLCKSSRQKFVSIAHSNFEGFWPDDQDSLVIADLLNSAERTFFVSRANLVLLETQLGTRLSNAEVIWNPYIIVSNNPSPWPEDSDVIKLACVGRLEPAAKGQDILIHLLAMPKWRSRKLTVSFCGSGKWESSLRRLVQMLDVEAAVRFEGHVDNVESIWRRHHALVLPSRYEGLPLTIVEAMLCGRTVVVTDVAGNAEVLEDEQTGFVATSPTVQHLDEAMERMWQRRHELQAIGERAQLSIRRQIPADPAELFKEKLLTLAKSID